MKIDKPYYEDNTRISNSAIGWFLNKGPRYYRDMLDGKEEGIKGSALDTGTMIHMYLLQPEIFWDNYEVLDFKIPTSSQQILFADKYVNSIDVEPILRLTTAFSQAYVTKGMSEKIVAEKALKLAKSLAPYIRYLELNKEGKKKPITFATLSMLKRIEANVNAHVKVKELLDTKADALAYNEFHINWEAKVNGIEVACKSLLDRLIIDHTNKKITLVDIKTTSNVWDFKTSVEKYDYYRQVAFYIMAINWYMNEDQGINIDDYDFEAYIVAIQTNGSNEVRVFNMFNQSTLLEKGEIISKTLTDIAWHSETNNWEHTRNYYENYGIDEL